MRGQHDDVAGRPDLGEPVGQAERVTQDHRERTERVPAAQVRANRILDLPDLTGAELAEEEPRPVTESEVEPLLGEEQGRPAGARVGHASR